MMLDMVKVKACEGYKIGSVCIASGKTYGTVTIPSDGFERLVGYMLPTGKWHWIHKEFRKS
jgi:hypothetical protein